MAEPPPPVVGPRVAPSSASNNAEAFGASRGAAPLLMRRDFHEVLVTLIPLPLSRERRVIPAAELPVSHGASPHALPGCGTAPPFCWEAALGGGGAPMGSLASSQKGSFTLS